MHSESAARACWVTALLGSALLLCGAAPALAQFGVPGQPLLDAPGTHGEEGFAPDAGGPCTTPPVPEARKSYTLWETVRESVCGKPDPARPFTPLYCSTLLSEGWCEP